MQTAIPPALPQHTADGEYLKLLSIFYYVMAGLSVFASFFGAIYMLIGAMMLLTPESLEGNGEAIPPFMGFMFMLFGIAFFGFFMLVAAAEFLTGRFIAQRRNHMFCLIMGGVMCMFMPLGTILGVFTIIVLMREPVKQSFEKRASLSQPEA